MDSKDSSIKNNELDGVQVSRRGFLGKGAMLGLAGAAVTLAGCKPEGGSAAAAPAAGAQAHAGGSEVKPGQLDDYYAFISSGHAGEARVLGMPSGRTLKRIPVFNIDCMVGWGITNESKAIMGTRPDGTLKYTTGDTHHVHGSYRDGTYDGRWLFINDKLHSRVVWLTALSTGSHLSGNRPCMPMTFGSSVILSHSMVSMRMRATRECSLSLMNSQRPS